MKVKTFKVKDRHIEWVHVIDSADFGAELKKWDRLADAKVSTENGDDGIVATIDYSKNQYPLKVRKGDRVVLFVHDLQIESPLYKMTNSLITLDAEDFQKFTKRWNADNGWFIIEDKVPPIGTLVLVYDRQSGYSTAIFDGTIWVTGEGSPYLDGPHLWKDITPVLI